LGPAGTGYFEDSMLTAVTPARVQVKREKKEKKVHADLTGLASIWGSTRAAQAALRHFEMSGKGTKVDDE
jgi:hypothetical protein